jgi:hypothetical protein
MNKYTFEAVKKQITAMNCTAFKLGIFDRNENKMINKDFLKPDDVTKLIPWLLFQNVSGKDIYISQANNLDRALILVDDINSIQINEMKRRGMSPACVIETSPNNFQAWISLGLEPMPKPERKIAAVLLAEQFSGDMASTDANHFGRLAGFTNKKDKYLLNNRHPFVLCREAKGVDAEKSQSLRDWARAKHEREKKDEMANERIPKSKEAKNLKPAGVAFSLYFGQWSRCVKIKGKLMDFSRGDFAVACRMLKEGYSKEEIAIALSENSPDIQSRKINHIEDYIMRTIKAALMRI